MHIHVAESLAEDQEQRAANRSVPSVDGPHFGAGVDVPEEHLLADLRWAAGCRAMGSVWGAGQQMIAGGRLLRVHRVAAQRAVASATAPMLHVEQ